MSVPSIRNPYGNKEETAFEASWLRVFAVGIFSCHALFKK